MIFYRTLLSSLSQLLINAPKCDVFCLVQRWIKYYHSIIPRSIISIQSHEVQYPPVHIDVVRVWFIVVSIARREMGKVVIRYALSAHTTRRVCALWMKGSESTSKEGGERPKRSLRQRFDISEEDAAIKRVSYRLNTVNHCCNYAFLFDVSRWNQQQTNLDHTSRTWVSSLLSIVNSSIVLFRKFISLSLNTVL